MTKPTTDPVHDKSPIAGCAIFITAFVVISFLVIFSITVLFRQAGEIKKFTDEHPARIVVETLEGQESALNQLAEKLEQFRLDMEKQENAELVLNVEELNRAIAAYELLKDFRNTLYVRSISKNEIQLDISFPLNGKPRFSREGEKGWITSDTRYLNGILKGKLALLDGEIVLAIDEIQATGKMVAKPFIEQMSPYRFAGSYLEHPVIGSIMKKLSSVEISEGQVILKKTAGVLPKNTISVKQVDAASERLFQFFAIAASLFLFFVAGVIFLGLRLKKKTSES